jgi:hypothetical protein
MKSIFSSLKHGLELIKKYNSMELCITTIDQIYTIHCHNDLFYIKCTKEILLEVPLKRVMEILFYFIIDSIEIYGSIGIRYISRIVYNYKNKFAQTIQVAWRKYRLRTARKRNDLVLHGLAEWWYHPSRITFEI